MAVQYIPGTWIVYDVGKGYFGIQGPCWDSGGITWGDKDAHLMAAAPEMLEALETVVRAIESPEWQAWEGKAFLTEARRGYPAGSGYQGEQFMESVKSAIAKARGETT